MSEKINSPGAATFTADLFEPLFASEQKHFWFRSRNRSIAALARTMPHFANVRDVMEHGCGTGFVLAELQRIFPQACVTGADLFAEGLDFARRRFSGTLLQVDVMNSGFKDAFDLIGFFDVLEHLDNDVEVLRALKEQLRPGGSLLLTVPAHMVLWSDYDVSCCHRRRYSKIQLETVLRQAGFHVEYCTQFMAALFPLMWARRKLFRSRAETKSDPVKPGSMDQSEFAIHSVPNLLLDWATYPEAWLIKHRVHLPLGTSLMALATRTPSGTGQGSK